MDNCSKESQEHTCITDAGFIKFMMQKQTLHKKSNWTAFLWYTFDEL